MRIRKLIIKFPNSSMEVETIQYWDKDSEMWFNLVEVKCMYADKEEVNSNPNIYGSAKEGACDIEEN